MYSILQMKSCMGNWIEQFNCAVKKQDINAMAEVNQNVTAYDLFNMNSNNRFYSCTQCKVRLYKNNFWQDFDKFKTF